MLTSCYYTGSAHRVVDKNARNFTACLDHKGEKKTRDAFEVQSSCTFSFQLSQIVFK